LPGSAQHPAGAAVLRPWHDHDCRAGDPGHRARGTQRPVAPAVSTTPAGRCSSPAGTPCREHAVSCWTRPVRATRQNQARIFDRCPATCQSCVVKILGPLDRATCQRLLDPHLRALDSCFRAAWSRWQKWLGTCEGPPTDMSPRTRASALYDFIAAEAVKSFAGLPGVLVEKKRGFLVIRFGDKVALRFKKFCSTTLRTSDNRTTQSTLFQSQRLEFSRFGRPTDDTCGCWVSSR